MSGVQTVTKAFLNALQGSHTQITQVDAYRGGRLLSPDGGLPVAGGQVTITAGQAIRTQVSVTVATATCSPAARHAAAVLSTSSVSA